jgi:membrane protein
MTDSSKPTPKPGRNEESVGELVKQASEQTAKLVRSEIRLAQLEIQQKAKHVGVGVGLFAGAGVIALLGVGAIVATAILLLATAVDQDWLAALIGAGALFAVASVIALTGKKQVEQATPPAPEEAIASVQEDVHEIKTRSSHP